MGEIEYYIEPENKNHKIFDTIKYIKLPLWPTNRQFVIKVF